MGLVAPVLKINQEFKELEEKGDDLSKTEKRKKIDLKELQQKDEDALKDGAGDGVELVTKAQVDLAKLEVLAKKKEGQGLVEFYGCSRCRFSRGGCISWNCNPQKFKVHYEKFPAKYKKGQKDLLDEVTAKMKDIELRGLAGD